MNFYFSFFKFLYCNSAFCPDPNEIVGQLYEVSLKINLKNSNFNLKKC